MIADIPEELEAEDDGEEFSNGIDRRAEKEEENKSEDGDYPSDFEEDEDHEEVSFLPTFFSHINSGRFFLKSYDHLQCASSLFQA